MIVDRRDVQARLDAIDPTWCTWSGVHGGYALAVVAALARGTNEGLPRAVHGTFLAPVPPQQALDVSVTQLRQGRSSAAVRAEVVADHGRLLVATSTFDHQRMGPDFERFPFPLVPPPEACEEVALLPVDVAPFTSHTDVRPASDTRAMAGGSDPELMAWVRLADAQLEPWQVVTVLLDALPPALYATATTAAFIPTSTISVALSDRAYDWDPSEWSLVRIRTDTAIAGWAVETSSVWNQQGTLLGCASQQRQILSPLHLSSPSHTPEL